MNHKRPPVPAIVLIVLVIAFSVYFIVTQAKDDQNGVLTASGTIEATQINISPEMAGKVKDVLVNEGGSVKAGDPLLVLDDSLLTAQRETSVAMLETAKSTAQTALAAYELAQTQYDLALTAARSEDVQTRTQDWLGKTPDYFNQPKWYFTREEQILAAQSEVGAAETYLLAAQDNLDAVINNLNNAQFVEAETRLANARISYLVALRVYGEAQAAGAKVSPDQLPIKLPPFLPDRYRIRIRLAKKLPNSVELTNAGEDVYDLASQELEDAQKAYDDLLTTDAAENVLEARAVLSVAQERYNVALDQLSALRRGEDSLQVTAAQGAMEQAQAAANQAQKAVQQAQANLDLIDVQIAKLTVYAPMDGVILVRNVEPGEFVQPGATAFSMADLNHITITVYVPEDRYGQITLGQQADVTVDSFPGTTFIAEVIHIADWAEFTPRNVQTVEGRSSTVYAIKLIVTNTEGRLKIGMPADVVFK